MRFIQDEKLYDTDKAKLVCQYSILNPILESKYDYSIYITPKNNFFKIGNDGTMRSLSTEEVKAILIQSNKIDEYLLCFGAVEEA